jgi:flagellar export protein FliJ
MKKFRFPLRTVATVRNLRELRARDQFSRSVHAYVAAEQRLQALRARVTELEEILRSGRLERFRAADQASFLEALKEETINATKADAEAATARAEMEAARQAWLQSRRDVRVIEKLEQKARRTHQQDIERETQAALDDRTNALAARAAASTS